MCSKATATEEVHPKPLEQSSRSMPAHRFNSLAEGGRLQQQQRKGHLIK